MKSLIGFPVEEHAYKIDLELQDRYTAYSSEILRLDLLGNAGYRRGDFPAGAEPVSQYD